MNDHLSRALRRLVPATGLALAALAIGALLGSARSSVAATAAAPTEKSQPTINGTAQQNRTLAANPGSWNGTSPITFSYQWLRCDSSGHSCASIPSADSQTYKLGSSDVGHTVRVHVTATNSSGSASDTSRSTDVVLSDPGETAGPSISGSPTEGKTLTAVVGNWIGTSSITFGYQWRRCNSSGGSCGDIGNATGKSYNLVSDDVGHTIRVHVTATDNAGTSSDTSGATNVIVAKAAQPVEGSSPPSISGAPTQGKTLTASPGSWSGTAPITFSYQWRRCNSRGNSCGDIRNATSSSYTLTADDVGHTIRVHVVAKNSVGSSSDTSTPTPVITKASAPPPATGCPSGNGPVTISQVSLPAQLTIDGLQSSPSPIGRNPGDVTLRFHVSACGGRSVAGALVYVTAVPFAQFSIPAEAATGSDGWVTEVMHQDARYPASPHQQLLAVFVRARKAGENVLGGVSARRLVSFPVDLRR